MENDEIERDDEDIESGSEPADDELLELLARSQIRANYRKSLGKEYLRKSWDEEIRKIFKKKSDC